MERSKTTLAGVNCCSTCSEQELPRGPLARVAVGVASIFISMAIVSPVLDDLVRQPFSLGNSEASWFLKMHSLPQLLLFGLLFGILSDKWARRVPLIVAGLIGTGLTTMAVPWIGSYSVLLWVRFADGLLGLMALGLLMTRAVDLAPEGQRARVLGLMAAAIPIGYLAGNGLAGVLGGERLGLLFFLGGVCVLVAGALLIVDTRRPESLRADAAPIRSLAALRGTLRLWPAYVFGFVDKFTFAGFALLTAPLLADRFGVTDTAAWASAALAGFWIAFMAMSPLAGCWSQRFGPLPLLTAGSAAYGMALFALGTVDSAWAFATLMSVCGVLTALQFTPNLALVGYRAAESERATAMQAFHISGSYGMVAGFAVLGILSTHGYGGAFAVAGGIEILCAILGGVLIAVERARKGGNQPAPAPTGAGKPEWSTIG